MTTTKIQDKDNLYEFLRPYVDWMFRRSYRHIRYLGKENIPTDGAVIYAPNHANALCDAMAILTIDPIRKVFVARADIFRKPRTAKLLTWLKMMPIRRIRDGIDEVRHNDETIDKAIDVLRDRVPFCIMPEGTHRPKHSLLPLSKGIFRIALQANDTFGADMPVYIVPVGLEYGDYYHLWDDLTVNIGKPINITRFVQEHAHVERPEQILMLRDELTLRMRELILWVPDDEHYEENLARLMANPPAPFCKHNSSPETGHLESSGLQWLRPNRRGLDRLRWRSGAPAGGVDKLSIVHFQLSILFPLFLVSLLLTIPLWLAVLIIRKKVKDPAFHNSVQFVWQLLFCTATLCIPLPFWLFVQEYARLWRKLKK